MEEDDSDARFGRRGSSSGGASSYEPAIRTQRMIEAEAEELEELAHQQRSSSAQATPLGLESLFPRKQPTKKKRKSRALNQELSPPQPSDHDPLSPRDDTPDEPQLDPVKIEHQEEMTDAQQRRSALAKLSRANDHALARNIAMQGGVLATMKKLDAAAKRAIDLAKSAATANQVLTAKLHLTYAVPGAPQPELSWFKHFFGKELPSNPDGVARELYLETIRPRPWTKAEQSALRSEVISYNSRWIAAEATNEGVDFADRLSRYRDDYFVKETAFLDFTKIASVIPNRSVNECRIQWLENDHPGVNKEKWKAEHLAKLYKLASATEVRDWEAIRHQIGDGRSRGDCARHVARRPPPRTEWTPELDNLLREGVRLFGESWASVAFHVGKTTAQCTNRWVNSVRPDMARGKWSKEEDALLRTAVQIHGTIWRLVGPNVGQRTDSQCRERWWNVVNPALLPYAVWTPEEDEKVFRMQAEGKTWGQMQIAFENTRTDNHCRARFAEILKLKAGISRTQRPLRAPPEKRGYHARPPRPSTAGSSTTTTAASTAASVPRVKKRPLAPSKKAARRRLTLAEIAASKIKYDPEGNVIVRAARVPKEKAMKTTTKFEKISSWAGPLLPLPLPPLLPLVHGIDARSFASGSGSMIEMQQNLYQPRPYAPLPLFVPYIPPNEPGHIKNWTHDPSLPVHLRKQANALLREHHPDDDIPTVPRDPDASLSIGPNGKPNQKRRNLKELRMFGPKPPRARPAQEIVPTPTRFTFMPPVTEPDIGAIVMKKVKVRAFIPIVYQADGNPTPDSEERTKKAEEKILTEEWEDVRAAWVGTRKRKVGFVDRRSSHLRPVPPTDIHAWAKWHNRVVPPAPIAKIPIVAPVPQIPLAAPVAQIPLVGQPNWSPPAPRNRKGPPRAAPTGFRPAGLQFPYRRPRPPPVQKAPRPPPRQRGAAVARTSLEPVDEELGANQGGKEASTSSGVVSSTTTIPRGIPRPSIVASQLRKNRPPVASTSNGGIDVLPAPPLPFDPSISPPRSTPALQPPPIAGPSNGIQPAPFARPPIHLNPPSSDSLTSEDVPPSEKRPRLSPPSSSASTPSDPKLKSKSKKRPAFEVVIDMPARKKVARGGKRPGAAPASAVANEREEGGASWDEVHEGFMRALRGSTVGGGATNASANGGGGGEEGREGEGNQGSKEASGSGSRA